MGALPNFTNDIHKLNNKQILDKLKKTAEELNEKHNSDWHLTEEGQNFLLRRSTSEDLLQDYSHHSTTPRRLKQCPARQVRQAVNARTNGSR